jgi:Ca-activated chloride channel family protein
MLPAAAPLRVQSLLIALLAALFTMLTLAAQAWAAPPANTEAAAPVPLRAMDEGGLFLPADRPGYVTPATTVETNVDIRVDGLVARARITQRFVNPTDRWTEGVYVFPLPENAAVDRLRLIIGERVVEGVIDEREAARARYEQARDAGQRASLVSQERPNIFTNAVANIAPGGSITVEIEYQQTLTYDQGAFRLRFPMVVLPRYIPGTPQAAPPQGTGWSFDTDRVPDASRITPPVARPGSGPVNPVTLNVRLRPGFEPASIDSSYHAVSIAAPEPGLYDVALDGRVWADRDFELVWRPAPSAAPVAGVFSETWEGEDYHLLMLMPPEVDAAALPAPPREVVFVVDSSGSMAGESIVQARRALHYGLDGLRPEDRFNIIAFDDVPTALYAAAKPADAANLAAGRRFVDGLVADNGTEMRSAIELALDGRQQTGRIRQVVFVTDGAVGNEAELFATIHDRLGDARLFTVGIGSAPNSHFMREASEAGRGTFTHIGAVEEVAERMGALFARLEHPALTDIAVDWPAADGRAEMYPAIIPDLYLGEPVVATVRLPAGTEGEVAVAGRLAGEAWSVSAALGGGRDAEGVAGLWARDRIAELERRRWRGGDPQAIRAEILEVALAHRIVSDYTSLVAIDEEMVRPADETPETEAVATNPPHGVEMEMVLGPAPADPQAAPEPSPREASLRAIRTMAATGSPEAIALPRGATPAQLNLLIGLGCLAAAVGLLLAARRMSGRRTAG